MASHNARQRNHVMPGRQKVDTWGGGGGGGAVPDCNNSNFALIGPQCPEQRAVLRLPCRHSGLPPLDGHYKKGP